MLTKGAIGNLVNRYKAVLKKCNLINTFGSLAVASMLVLGGVGVAGATIHEASGERGKTVADIINTKGANSVQDGDTIKITASHEGDGFQTRDGGYRDWSDKGITFDFNNCTYDVSGEAVESKGYETQGAQLLYDKVAEEYAKNNITFKNGTFTATSNNVLMLINNYINLTIDNMVIDGSKLANAGTGQSTGVATSCLNSYINESKIITTNKDIAVAVIYNNNERYDEGVSMSISDFEIVGKIKMYGDEITTGAYHDLDLKNLTLTNNDFTGNGGALSVETRTANATITDCNFESNKVSGLGGAIYNIGTINFSGSNTFGDAEDAIKANTANGVANDIHNLGTVNVLGGETTIGGGITGDGKVNVKDGTLKFLVDAGASDNTFTIGNNDANSKATLQLSENASFDQTINGKGVATYDYEKGKPEQGKLTVEGATIALDEGKVLEVATIDASALLGDIAIVGEGTVKLTGKSTTKEDVSILPNRADGGFGDYLIDVAELQIGHDADTIAKDEIGNVYGINKETSHADFTADKITITGANGGSAIYINGDSKAAVHIRGFKNGLTLQNVSDGSDYGYVIASNSGGNAYNRVTIDGEGQIDIIGTNRSAIYTAPINGETIIKTSGEDKDVNISTAGISIANANENARKGSTVYASGGVTHIEATKGNVNILAIADREKNDPATVGNRAIGIAEGGTVSLKAGGSVNIEGDITDAVDYSTNSTDTGKLILEGGNLSVKSGTVSGFTGLFEQKGGTVALTTDNGFFGGNVNVTAGLLKYGDIDLSEAPTATATLAVGDALELNNGQVVSVGTPDPSSVSTIAGGSALNVHADGLLIVDIDASVSGDTFTAESGSKIHVVDARSGVNIMDFKNDIDTSNATVSASRLQNITIDKDGIITVEANTESALLLNAIPTEALTSIAENGGDTQSADMGMQFLSRAADGVKYALTEDESIATINEVSRAAVTAGVQNTSLRIADAASNTVLDHLSLAQHDGSKAIHADGADFWAAPMYGNLYTSGMNVAGNSVRGQFGGLALGADLEAGQFLGGKFRLGASINGGGGQSETKGTATSTQNDYDFGGLNFYAGWNSGAFNVIASVGYGFGNHEVEMGLPSGMGMGTAKADIDTTVFTADLRAEYQLKTSWVDVLPHVGIRYTALKTDAHDLSVNGSVLNSVASDTQNIVQFPIGVTLSKDFAFADWNVKPMIDMSVIPAAGDKKATSKVNFAGLDAWDSVNTRIMDSTSWAGTIGVQAEKGNMTFGLNYGVQASSNETDQNVQVKFGWKF